MSKALKQNDYRVPSGTNNNTNQVGESESGSLENESLPSKPSKLQKEGGILSRIFKRKKTRQLSKHDLTATRSEAEVKKKIRTANNEFEKKKTASIPESSSARAEPGAPLLVTLFKSLNCGLAEPLPTQSRDNFNKSLVEMREAVADGRKNYLDDINAVTAGTFVAQLVASGDILKAAGKSDEGVEYMLEAIQICRRHPTLKLDLAGVLNDVGLLYCDLHEFKDAKKSLLESHSILLDIYGDVHPDVASSAGNLGVAYSGCKENSASSDMIGNAIKAMEAIYGKDHEYTLQQRGLLGSSLITAGDASEARKELRAVISRLKQLSIYQDSHPFLLFLEQELESAQRLATN